MWFGKAVVYKARAHKLAIPYFRMALTEIKNAGLAQKALQFGGIYNYRPIRGQSVHLSTHSWGVAIDIDAATNPLGGPSTLDQDIIDIFKKHGFFWGGD